MSFLSWLIGGNDAELAKQYAGESATERARRRRVERHRSRGVPAAKKAAARWEAEERRRFG